MKASKRSVERAPILSRRDILRPWVPGKNWERREKARELVRVRATADRLHPELSEEDRAFVAKEMHQAQRVLLGKEQP